MEALEAVSGGEWNSFDGMFSEEADFMAHLLGNCSLPEEVPSNSKFGLSSYFCPDHDLNVSMVSVDGSATSDETNSNIYCFSQGSGHSGCSNIFFPSSNNERNWPCVSHIFTDNNLTTDKKNSNQVPLHINGMMEGGDFLSLDAKNFESDKKLPEDVRGKNFQLRNGYEARIPEPMKEDESSSLLEILKKRPRIPGEFERSKKRVRTNKGVKVDENANNNTNLALHRQSSSSFCSEDELNGVTSSSSSKGSGALKLNGTTRACRGSATDPQSLYARKRRERINERLRILQNLVPNGTKVDISTMLEEAVQYVKFLQLQIKLLSSDDLWMYAPIACNGMDIGLDLTISNPEPQS